MSFNSDIPSLANQLPLSFEFENNDKFFENLQNLYKKIAAAVNTKDGALYNLQEISNFQQFFTDSNPQAFRNAYRSVFRFTNTLTFNHNITGITECTRIYGTAVDSTGNFIPLPFVSTNASDQIKIVVNSSQVIITRGATAPTLTQGIIVLEYVKT